MRQTSLLGNNRTYGRRDEDQICPATYHEDQIVLTIQSNSYSHSIEVLRFVRKDLTIAGKSLSIRLAPESRFICDTINKISVHKHNIETFLYNAFCITLISLNVCVHIHICIFNKILQKLTTISWIYLKQSFSFPYIIVSSDSRCRTSVLINHVPRLRQEKKSTNCQIVKSPHGAPGHFSSICVLVRNSRCARRRCKTPCERGWRRRNFVDESDIRIVRRAGIFLNERERCIEERDKQILDRDSLQIS